MKKKPAPRKSATKRRAPKPALAVVQAADLDAVRHEIRKVMKGPRWNPKPEDVQRSVAKLVLTLAEFLRRLMERQAIRRMEEGTLEDAEVEAVGVALMRLEETLLELAKRFEIPAHELNLDLGPLGRLH